MSITHCPLCVGLAVLSAVRFMAHGVLLWQLRRGESNAGPRLRWRTA
ncbi:MAG: hypothetical protein ACOVNL_10205 [Prochlorococcaceae cyanobacterium]|jgi:hypothetical protein